MATEAATWHTQRRHAILQAHPEIRYFHGHDPLTFTWVVALVVGQTALAAVAQRVPWPVLLLMSLTIGAFANHAAGVLIHEAGHNLIFARGWQNRVAAIFANVPLAAPAAMEFRVQHLLHHQYLGDVQDKDTQAPTPREANAVGTSAWRKILAFTLGRFYFPGRPASKVPVDGYVVANWVIVLAGDAALVYVFGWKALAYWAIASLVAFGPHTTGARRLSEHMPVKRNQPTNSYYGLVNRVSFDVGYHVEHHDFPGIPWRKMRALRKTAAPFYDSLFAYRSWTRLLLEYFFDPRYRVDLYVGLGRSLEDARDSV